MPYHKVQDLPALISKKDPGNIFMFAGEDAYSVENGTGILLKWADAGEFNTETYFGQDLNISDLILSIQTMPFLSDKKTVVLKNAERLKTAEEKKLAEALKSGITAILIIQWNEKINSDTKSSVLFKQADEAGTIIECRPLYDNEVPSWVVKNFSQRSKRITPDALNYLIEQNGGNLIDLNNEIEKLELFTSGKKDVELEDVETVSGHTKLLNLNNLQEALETKRVDQSIRIAEKLINEGEIPLVIIASIYRALRKLLIARVLMSEEGATEADAARQLRIHPYFARPFFQRLSRFKKEELIEDIGQALEADRKIKSTTIPVNTVVDELLIFICRKTT